MHCKGRINNLNGPIQGVVIPIGAVVTAATGVKKRSRVKGSRAVFGVGQAVKDNFQTW